ncbi:MAG: PaaI family thioesterase [Pseudomonadota bacterium]|nr:PaaI family thioesterase [Pseudomonadota bacterium]
MDDAEGDFTPPDGFRRSRRGPFTEHNGPVYHRDDTDQRAVQGFRILKRHCNGLGIVHGGMLATFIDGLLGHAVGAAAKRPGVTIHLSLDYLAMARAGEWVEGEARVTRLTKDVAFAEARAFVGARDVIRASAIFKLMERKRA